MARVCLGYRWEEMHKGGGAVCPVALVAGALEIFPGVAVDAQVTLACRPRIDPCSVCLCTDKGHSASVSRAFFVRDPVAELVFGQRAQRNCCIY